MAIDSTAPAAPSRWPIIDFGAVATAWSAALPSALRIATDFGDVAGRRRGRVRVDVDDVAGGQVALAQRLLHRALGTGTGRVGLHDVVAVGGDAGAGELGVDLRAAGDRVLVRSPAPGSPAPSPSRKPSRSTSHGRDARSGSSLRLLSASSARTRPAAAPVIEPSAPPATTMSARPSRIWSDGQRDRLVAGGARRHRRLDAGQRAELEADVRGGRVRHQHRDRERRHPARALLQQRRSSTGW